MSTEGLSRGVRSVLMSLQREGFGVLGKLHEGTCLLDEPTSSAHVGVTMMPELASLPPNYIMIHRTSLECHATSQHSHGNSCSVYDRQRHRQKTKPILLKEMHAQRMLLMFITANTYTLHNYKRESLTQQNLFNCRIFLVERCVHRLQLVFAPAASSTARES